MISACVQRQGVVSRAAAAPAQRQQEQETAVSFILRFIVPLPNCKIMRLDRHQLAGYGSAVGTGTSVGTGSSPTPPSVHTV